MDVGCLNGLRVARSKTSASSVPVTEVRRSPAGDVGTGVMVTTHEGRTKIV